MLDDVERDWKWADKFLAHQAEIARNVIRVDVAPIEDDLRRNTDLVMRTAGLKKDLRISARVRRHEFAAKLNHLPGLEYRKQFTIRDRRPSGVATEMDKIRLGDGDILVYGFESETGSGRLYPWAVINLDLVREYDRNGGYSTVKRNGGPRGSWLRAFCIDDLPLGAVLNSDGITGCDRTSPWHNCRNPNWDDPDKPIRSGWCSRGYAVADDYMRNCLFCGFKWRAGWSPA